MKYWQITYPVENNKRKPFLMKYQDKRTAQIYCNTLNRIAGFEQYQVAENSMDGIKIHQFSK